ncbi:MAG: HAD hydrolase-like protein, partial [Actinomycetota bacterium]|nr:HAD hydrolase-like protein [Actinomycetota bacterium]
MIEAVIFDLDGVLLDSEQVWDEAREQLARERDGRWHENAQRDMMGMSSVEWSRYMHDVIGLPEPPEEISREVVRRLADLYRARLPVVPGAR